MPTEVLILNVNYFNTIVLFLELYEWVKWTYYMTYNRIILYAIYLGTFSVYCGIECYTLYYNCIV